MGDTVVCSISRNTLRTDLSLLLECLKFQMKCPEMQKQALLAIHSVCENREDAVDILREMGGVTFVYNLSKSSIVHSDVKRTALFTLGTLAEANVYCKNSLCRKETFAQLADVLIRDNASLTQKRVSVYLLSVLVANNKTGQTLAQTSGCLDVLLDLFRTSFPQSTEATMRTTNTTQTYQLWASVSIALCGCVNNPQNEEGQRICVAFFPMIKVWLQEIAMPRTEIFQPICSFIAMTVANNTYVQESFFASGGLDTLSLALVHLASAAETSLLSCQICANISKTMSACIADNSSLASGLAQYGLVSHLFSVLMSPHLESDDRLSVLLTLGHCTEASEAHQFQLVQSGGLPLIITLLTEDTSEEVRKAATLILQTCKQATMMLGVPGLMTQQGEGENGDPLGNIEGFRSSARELLHRLDLLEKRQVDKDNRKDAVPSTSFEGQNQSYDKAEDSKKSKLQTVQKIVKNKRESEPKTLSSRVNEKGEKAKTSGGDITCLVCMGTGTLHPLEGGRGLQSDNQFLQPPTPFSHSLQREISCTEKSFQGCKMSEAEKIQVKEHLVSHNRCTGCLLSFDEVNSRTFTFLQSSCQHSCDMHKVLQEATESFRKQYCDLLLRGERQDNTVGQRDSDSQTVSASEPQTSWKSCHNFCLTPIHKGAGKNRKTLPQQLGKKHNGFNLTPLQRGTKENTLISSQQAGLNLIPLKRSSFPEATVPVHMTSVGLTLTLQTDSVPLLFHPVSLCCHPEIYCIFKMSLPNAFSIAHSLPNFTRRKRKDFSIEEVHYLLNGVKTYGFSWNKILWSYPFKSGRTNVTLAKKYRQLMKAGCAESCP